MDISKKSLHIDLAKLEGWKKNPSIVFLILLVVLFVCEAVVIKDSLSLISALNKPSIVVPSTPGARINFDAYKQIVQRIEQAKNFQPSGEPTVNPFAGTVASGQ